MQTHGDKHPMTAAIRFRELALEQPVDESGLENWVTPESRPYWGDFSAVADDLQADPGHMIGSGVKQSTSPDVVYVQILAGGVEPGIYREATLVPLLAALTLVWRPEVGRWLLHGWGGRLAPHEILHARTSPEVAPEY